MNIRKAVAFLGLFVAFAVTLPVAHADEADQATRFTFSQPVQVPGKTLPAGTYWFRMSGTYDRTIVQILNADRTEVLATVFSVSSNRPKASDRAAVSFAQRGDGLPEAIVAWFYPGEATGHELLYPKQESKQLAQAKHELIVAGD